MTNGSLTYSDLIDAIKEVEKRGYSVYFDNSNQMIVMSIPKNKQKEKVQFD